MKRDGPKVDNGKAHEGRERLKGEGEDEGRREALKTMINGDRNGEVET